MTTAHRLFRIVGVALLPVAAGVASAEASCDGSHIQVLTQATVIDRAIPVTWSIDRACSPVETGISVSGASGELVASGVPIHGEAGLYGDEIIVQDTGPYWVTAYAIDEQGSVVQSPPRVVLVIIPSLPTADPSEPPLLRSSTRAPLAAPAFTGTDADFLVPTGNVHMAAIKSEHMQDRGESHSMQGETAVVVTVVGAVSAASTTRADVAAQFDTPLTIGGESFTWNAASIQGALDDDLAFFQSRGFPRPGLYGVGCSGTKSTLFIDGSPLQSFGQSQVCGAGSSGLRMAFREASSQSPHATASQSTRSSLTYFIPRAPSGAALQDAKLRLNVQATGSFLATNDFSVFRLNGKAPSAVGPTFCSPFNCDLFATWDFTDEARTLTSQGGGLLTLAVDAIPPLVSQFPGQSISTAYWAFQPHVDYPWSFGGSQNALTLTFKQTCPHDLTMAVTPSTVRPKLPGNTKLHGELATMATRAAIEATVRSCPPDGSSSPASVDVQFAVDPSRPQPGTPDAGGHAHDTRPARARGTLNPSSCTAILDAGGVGTCRVTYDPSEVSSVETLTATAAGFPGAQARVSVQVPGLTNLADVFTNFFRLTGQTPAHRDNHWGTAETAEIIQLVALDYFTVFGATLGINDLSLRTGGLFDISGDWSPPHKSHRTGTSVDIDRTACLDPRLEGGCGRGRLKVAKDFVAQQCADRGKGFLVPEASIHCELPR